MKQRLVGILVVGCLAVIIIPVLLDGEGIQPPPLATTIPPAPEFSETVIPEPTRPVIIGDSLDSVVAEEDTAGQLAALEASSTADPALPVFEPEEAAEPVVTAVAEQSVGQRADGQQAVRQQTVEQEVDQTTEPAADEPDALEAAVAAIMAKVDAPRSTSADATPRLDRDGLPASFVVRLGSFGEKANADALVKQLLDADYKAYSRAVNTSNGVFNAVYVGPVITRAEANDLVNKLSTRFQLKGVVENFTMQALP